MARMLKSISLLLIGSGMGALAANGLHDAETARQRVDAVTPSATAEVVGDPSAARAAIPRAQVTQIVQIDTRPSRAVERRKADRLGRHDRLRHARAPGFVSDELPLPRPRMRPILVRTGETHAPDADNGRSAEVRLAEAIQKELKRVGCYAGNIDGDWGPGTRRAMSAFNDRVNATLPVDQPDYILLTLLQGHTAKACGAACPRGQELSDAKKCLPRSVIAEKRRRLSAERKAASNAPRAAVALSSDETETSAPATRDEAPSKALNASRKEARAALERQRIAAAEAQRKRDAAEITARQEAERQARIATAEKARVAAEALRRQEIAALSERAAKRAEAAAAPRPVRVKPSAVTASLADSPPPLPVRPSPAFQHVAAFRTSLQARSETAAPAPRKATRRHSHRRAHGQRYAGRYMPPPTYRVGRLPAYRTRGVRVYAYTQRRSYNPQRIFRRLQYLMP